MGGLVLQLPSPTFQYASHDFVVVVIRAVEFTHVGVIGVDYERRIA